jgi:hypothetical protein
VDRVESEAADLARRLVRRLAALPEPTMRKVVLAQELTAHASDDAVRILRELIHGAREHPGPPYSVAVAALALTLDDAERLPYDVRASLYATAKEADLPEVARLFFSLADQTGTDRAPAPERMLVPHGRVLTLGERKALARGPQRDLIARLLRDPDPQVIRNILENPKLTEQDVVVIAARRPARADVLRQILTSRWLARYHVKRALVMNPYTPTDVAVRLLAALTGVDLRAVSADPNLAEDVRAQAEILRAARARTEGF